MRVSMDMRDFGMSYSSIIIYVTMATAVQTQGPVLQTDKKHKLGSRAFLIFLSRRIKFAIFLFVLAFATWYAERWVPLDYSPWTDYAVKILFLIAAFWFIYIFLRTY